MTLKSEIFANSLGRTIWDSGSRLKNLKYKIEPITFVMTNQLPFAEGNVIKYIMRWRDKNGIQDLKKAKRYIDLIIELEETGNIDPKKEWKE